MTKKKTFRMNLEMSEQVREKLERISGATDESLSQVVRRSVAIYDLLLTETNGGGTIVIRSNSNGGEKEVLLV
jgi:hypothetical protein